MTVLASEDAVCAFCRPVPPPAAAPANYTPAVFDRGQDVLKKDKLTRVESDAALTALTAKCGGTKPNDVYEVSATLPPDGAAVTHRRVRGSARCVRVRARFFARLTPA
jgi:hypothetical protein